LFFLCVVFACILDVSRLDAAWFALVEVWHITLVVLLFFELILVQGLEFAVAVGSSLSCANKVRSLSVLSCLRLGLAV
jgi:hypothetical protein